MIEASNECSNCGYDIYNCGICNKVCCGSCSEVTEITCLVCKTLICQDHLALCWCQCADGVCIQCIDLYNIECTECSTSYPVSHFYHQGTGYICYDAGDPILCNLCIPIYNDTHSFKYWRQV